MADSPHSLIMDLTHFTTGLPEHEVRGLAERHGVHFEVHPEHLGFADGRKRSGWSLDLFAARSEADAELHGRDVSHHLDDVLRAIARAAIFPEGEQVPEGMSVEFGVYNGAVIVDTKHDFKEEVRLRISVHDRLEDDGDDTDERSFVDELRKRLLELGCKG